MAKEAPEVVLTTEESQSPYTGEVEINVEMPIEPAIVAKLYNYLQTTPEIKFVRTAGSWNKGSAITIALEKPIPLLATLVAKLPEANVLPERGGAIVAEHRNLLQTLRKKDPEAAVIEMKQHLIEAAARWFPYLEGFLLKDVPKLLGTLALSEPDGKGKQGRRKTR